MKKLQEFFYSVWYLILLSVVTLIIWSLDLENYGVPAILLLMFVLFLFNKDTMPTVPLLMNGLFMVSQTNWSFAEAPLYLYMTPITIILGMVIHIFKYRVNIFRGKMLLGIGIMVLAMALSTINAEEVTIYYLFYISIGILYAFIYMFYRNSFDRDHTNYLMKMMVILGFLIVGEMIVYYASVDDFYQALESKSINLGWGISNYIATYLIMFVAISFYYAKTSSYTFFWFFVSALMIIAVAFTESRGGIVAMIVMLPVLVYFLLKGSQKKIIFILIGLVLLDIAVVIGFIYKEMLLSLFFRFDNLLFDDTGRMEIYSDAISKFLEHPIFGAGLFARVGDKDYTMFHNMFLHTIATIGLIGLSGLIIQLISQVRIVIKAISTQSIFISLALLGAYIHSLVDNVYFMPQFMIIMLISIGTLEFTSTNQSTYEIY